jgi:hypothetical protein
LRLELKRAFWIILIKTYTGQLLKGKQNKNSEEKR